MRFSLFTRVLASLASFVIIAPLISLLTKVPWSSFFDALANNAAIKLSLWTATLAAVISLLLGVPLAWVLAKSSNRFTNLLRPLVLAPIVLPPTVAGIALISLMGRNGLLGKYIYQQFGWAMPFTSSAVVLAGVFVGLPFVVLI
ncbi:MAG: molybdate ABC transporter permease subunit, partial [Candidatus Nanopelagicaceae bacterium]